MHPDNPHRAWPYPKERREHPRTPGKFKEAEDAAYTVMREVGVISLDAPNSESDSHEGTASSGSS